MRLLTKHPSLPVFALACVSFHFCPVCTKVSQWDKTGAARLKPADSFTCRSYFRQRFVLDSKAPHLFWKPISSKRLHLSLTLERLCCVFALCSAIHQQLPVAFKLHSRAAVVAILQDFVVITESRATAASVSLSSVYFSHGSVHNDSLFIKWNDLASTQSVLFWN